MNNKITSEGKKYLNDVFKSLTDRSLPRKGLGVDSGTYVTFTGEKGCPVIADDDNADPVR